MSSRIGAAVPVLATELAEPRVDVIIASGPKIPAVKAATAGVPVVMSAGFDPVMEGLLPSVSRSGNNLTEFKCKNKW